MKEYINMNLKYYEKVTISIIIFLGVVIATAYIIGIYNNRVKANKNSNNNNHGNIVLENVNLF